MMYSPIVTTTESPSTGGSLPPHVVLDDHRLAYDHLIHGSVTAKPCAPTLTTTSRSNGSPSVETAWRCVGGRSKDDTGEKAMQNMNEARISNEHYMRGIAQRRCSRWKGREKKMS